MHLKILILAIMSTTTICSALVVYRDGIKGTATYYNPPYTPSACYQTGNHGVLVAAASKALWRNKKACGHRFRVRCIGATNLAPQPCKTFAEIDVKIVDYCPTCTSTINLSRDAFNAIANLSAGRIRIQYHQKFYMLKEKNPNMYNGN